MEIELQDKKEQAKKLEVEKQVLSEKLAHIYKDQENIREDLVQEYEDKLQLKDRESRKLYEQLQSIEQKYEIKIDSIRVQNVGEIQKIEEKVKIALQ